MKRKTKKHLVNHKLYCGKLYARIGGTFKEIDMTVQQIAQLENGATKNNDVLSIAPDNEFIMQGRKWKTTSLSISNSFASFAQLSLEAVCTEMNGLKDC
jgi:hypothetical protein